MSTINGFATMYYGWTVRPDGDAEATRWFVMAFFPIVPLARHRIRILDPGEAKGFFSLSAKKETKPQFELIESLSVQPKDVIGTYLKGFLLTPILLLLPPGLTIWLVTKLNGPIQPANSALGVGIVIGLFLYWAVIVSSILDLASGRRAARLATEDTVMEAEVIDDFEEA